MHNLAVSSHLTLYLFREIRILRNIIETSLPSSESEEDFCQLIEHFFHFFPGRDHNCNNHHGNLLDFETINFSVSCAERVGSLLATNCPSCAIHPPPPPSIHPSSNAPHAPTMPQPLTLCPSYGRWQKQNHSIFRNFLIYHTNHNGCSLIFSRVVSLI